MPRAGASKGSPEWKARVSAGLRRHHERRRAEARIRPRDLERLRASGTVAPSMQPLLRIAAEESAELIEALGGPDQISPQRRILVEDLTATGIVLRSELARFLQTGEGDAAARVGSLAGSRRASLAVLGLERLEREIDLSTYLAGREVAVEGSRPPESDSAAEDEPA